VLRLRDGASVSATDGRGGLVICTFSASTRSLAAAGPLSVSAQPAPAVTVAFAPVKGDRPEWAVQKLTELGVDHIVLMGTERSVVRWEGARAAAHVARLERVAREALMQSRGTWLPSISLTGFTDLSSAAGVCVAAPGASVGPSLSYPTVLIGPEGGFSPAEMSRGLPTVSLARTVLRAETAAVAAGVLLTALRAGLV
jgi:16S rRNA (uracil1498-N3)-methyltransferase